ncbi:YciI family protein [Frateuria sp. STR12]|uniref:YciI family protein n=1 Tax=Frateuria hangzhouensis TaxID=2995589 RepID=UPI002260C284|nr:YciI family protein [Frateuria sp. STR12]MCX7514295.1 YciI family protein [Frateuria sp. STR12]
MKLYLVMVMRRPQFDAAVVPAHQRFLDELRAEGRVERYGPFADRTGGAYLLQAADLAEARTIAHRDPTHVSGGWDVAVYEWQAH